MGRFEGKVVAVLGGSAGIGRATALAFKDEGAAVAITGRDASKLDALASDSGLTVLVADMGDVAATREALGKIANALGGIDVLCVNAGVGGFAPGDEVTEAFWDQVHDVNLRGAFFATQSALPHLNDGGSIVFTGSIGAYLALAGNAVYAAAKAGLRAAAKTWGVELLPRGIRVNMVSPGPTETEIFKRGASDEDIEALRNIMTDAVPMKRMGEPEDIARAILFLASEEASFINGVDLFVDGGSMEL